MRRSKLSACPTSSKAITTTAAPKSIICFAREVNSSSPSFREMELTIPFPCRHCSPSSITDQRDESIIIGSFAMSGSEAIRLRNFTMAASESSIPSSIFTSMICAPPSTCWRATDKAASKSPLSMSLENLGDPVTFVRSPILTKRLSSVTVTASSPLKRRKGFGSAGLRGFTSAAFFAMLAMC